ncbi:putative transmembrane signal peptide protein [Ancylobacter novellus DSM 506]|uniref:Transmembrane signal peptide protein n=1 Tax=Ancylobacter novellus (strain ATCC 8093 / DSM 506 / JCM 20403 / CCM 1077 / IAM 12100 / NBRC 12443 / NCIMB 10456) TaxID=639283 RepID=D7A648_ANCN5|nr:TIGR02281 family clan AA aspartic protease [Ancylobacter novellus]ADH88198.1 putative transmembrane signal peptide protein [Ancylobacter novellus DSM 506]
MNADRVMWTVVIGLAAGVGLIFWASAYGNVGGLGAGEIAQMVFYSSILLVVGAGLFASFTGRLGEALRAALLWLVIFAVLGVGYTYRYELHAVAYRVLAELAPGYAVPLSQSGGPAVEVARARDGDFNVRVEINGNRIPMLVDTGASSVVLTPEDAVAVGLPIEFLRYDIPIDTANGRGKAAAVVLDRVSIAGSIEERDVPALIASPGTLKHSLLGMSFLSRLASFEIRGEKLVMRAKVLDE